MTPKPLVHKITADEAEIIRALVGTSPPYDPAFTAEIDRRAFRIFLPIERGAMRTSDRARCRLCDRLLKQGEPIIRFEFDPRAMPGPSAMGHTNTAYLHVRCPDPEEEP